jgi:5'-nucleotidase
VPRALLLRLALVLALAACARLDSGPADIARITIVDISDWHGQLEPVSVVDGGQTRMVGGAAALKTYFDAERAANPQGTLVVTAGDAFGATPPLSAFFDDVPAVIAANLMGIDVDTLGNHNFDHGVAHLRALMAHARFPYVAANIVAADGTTLVERSRLFTLNGVRVGVLGIGNPETPSVVAPGRIGEFQFFPPVPAMNAEARALRARGAEIVIVLAHVGAVAVAADGTPRGQIVEMARAARGVDVVVGDHTDMTVNTVIDGVLVVESRSKGVEYAVITVDYDRRARAVVSKAAVHKRPWTDAVRPDPTVQALIEEYRGRSRPLFDVTVGETAVRLGRSREEESRLGNLETDALRVAYGTDLAFDVSGALRDDVPSTYQPADRRLRRPAPGYAAGPPWDVVEGDLYAVFPFNNVAVTFQISGRTVWAALENSVGHGAWVEGRFRNGLGRFLQVSGLRYAFDPRRSPGERVVAVTRASGEPIPRDDTVYTAVTSDFVYNGGDGYTMLANGTGVTREPIAETIGRALRARGSATAAVEGRITIAP